MGITTGVISAIAAVAGTTASVVQGNAARADARHSADLQKQAQQQVVAQNAQQAAEAQRQQVRDARVQQARVMQGASNSGADLSSGELGAVGALSTNLSNNQEQSLGAQQRSETISNLNQGAADSAFESRQGSQIASEYGSFGQLGGSIFGATTKIPSVANKINTIFK